MKNYEHCESSNYFTSFWTSFTMFLFTEKLSKFFWLKNDSNVNKIIFQKKTNIFSKLTWSNEPFFDWNITLYMYVTVCTFYIYMYVHM